MLHHVVNTSLFTAIKAIALESWPARDPDRLVVIRATSDRESTGPSMDEYRFIKEHIRSFSGVAVHVGGTGQTALRASGRPVMYPRSVWISANFLDVLGARMHMGTGFIPQDDGPGNHRGPAVISHFLWRSQFAADPDIVGQSISVNDTPLTIIGVLEPRIDGLNREMDLWMVMACSPERPCSPHSSPLAAHAGWTRR